MPCQVYDALHREWEQKFRAEVSAHDGYKERSIKASLAERDRTTSERVAAGHSKNRHVNECEVCKSEGQKPHEVDHHGPFH